jgi:8-amino-7-oxononanoate synthase
VGPIVPVILGDSARAVSIARRVQSQGFDVRAVRPPAVRPRTARLRVSVHADHTEEQVDHLAEAILEALAQKETTR